MIFQQETLPANVSLQGISGIIGYLAIDQAQFKILKGKVLLLLSDARFGILFLKLQNCQDIKSMQFFYEKYPQLIYDFSLQKHAQQFGKSLLLPHEIIQMVKLYFNSSVYIWKQISHISPKREGLAFYLRGGFMNISDSQ